MAIILDESDKIYIKNHYPNVHIGEDKLIGDFEFVAKYKGLEIKDCFSLTINLISRNGSNLPMVRDNTDRVMNISKKFEKKLSDIHINYDNTFCLVSDKEEKYYLTEGLFNFPDFFKKILEPYLYQMSFFEKKGFFPWGERPHGELAYFELYNEGKLTFQELIESNVNIPILVKQNQNIKGHHLCLCGSGKKIRSCHNDILEAFYKLRKNYG